MNPTLGLLAAFGAFLSWGIGDFAIQRSARAVGSMAALFGITAFGAIVLFPFAAPHLSAVFHSAYLLGLLLLTVLVTLFAAVFEFEALKKGKIAVIEPIMCLELVVTVGISVVLLQEKVTTVQFLLMALIFSGILLTVIRHEPRHWWGWWRKKRRLERGVLLVLLGAFTMGITNVVTGRSSQETDPVTAIWFIHTSLALICLIWFIMNRNTHTVMREIRIHWRPVLAEGVFDNAAWLSYAAAVTYFPISITNALTEGYIVLASVLGIIFNKERVQKHQAMGMVITIISAIVLAAISG
ncbi:MAG: DMT family transporter [Patescibacteria group bacterium]|jgi:drug/metabolite transporter (DMT)-like permease